MYLIFDTETTGLPKRYNAPVSDTDNWPRCIQIAWQLHDDMGRLIEHEEHLVKPDGFDIPYDSERIHGISTDLAAERGLSLEEVAKQFGEVLAKAKFLVGQNVGFDVNIMGCELFRLGMENPMPEMQVLDTCTENHRHLVSVTRRGAVENSSFPRLQNFTNSYLISRLMKRTMHRPM